MQYLFSAPYGVFTTILLFVLVLALIEIALFFIGSSTSSLFEDGDVDVDVDFDLDPNLEIDFDLDVSDGASTIFEIENNSVMAPESFFNIGKIPFFVILLTLGITFSLFGIFLHKFTSSMGIDLSILLSVPLSVGFSSVATWGITNVLSKILPGEESYAIEQNSFLGREAVVEAGEGSSTLGAVVSFVDEYGTTHRLLGTVALDGITVKKGEKVVILNKNNSGGGFYILPSFEEAMKNYEMNNVINSQLDSDLSLEKMMTMTKS